MSDVLAQLSLYPFTSLHYQKGQRNHNDQEQILYTVVVGMSILHLQLYQVSYCVLKAVEKNQLTPRFYFDIFLTAIYKVIGNEMVVSQTRGSDSTTLGNKANPAAFILLLNSNDRTNELALLMAVK